MLALSFSTLLVEKLMFLVFLVFLEKLVFDENTGKVSNILGGCLFESVLTIWCSSLLEDARAILSV